VVSDRHGRLGARDKDRAAFWPSIVVADSNLTIQILALHRILDQGLEREEVASKQSLSAAAASWFR
jgi:hypothetical protein